MSGYTLVAGTYPIDHHVAEPDRFEHPDKAGHPHATHATPSTQEHPMT